MSSSEWQPRQQDPFARVVARVEKIGRDAEQRVNYLLRNAGLRVAEGALHVLQRLVVEGDQEVTGSLDVTGDAEFTGDTSIGGTLGVTGRTTLGGDTSITGDTDVTGDLDVEGRAGFTGDTTIGGNLSVTGTLSLPAGIIDNDALANPLTFRSDFGRSDDFGFPGGWVELASASITVPAGFTRMLMYTTGVVLGFNDRATIEYLDARISYQVNGTGPIRSTVTTGVDVRPDRSAVAVVPGIWSEPVTPGDTWRFWIEGWTIDPWSADDVNHALVEVACLFTR